MPVQTKEPIPEETLLISLCRLKFSDEQTAAIRENINLVTDWNYFAGLANEHGIIALVAHNLKENGFELMIPRDAMGILENGYMQSLVRNTWLTERWKEVNTILCNAGIKHILLKGMALEHTIYGAKGLRQMNDNDILLKQDDALRAWQLLQKEGFTTEIVKSPLLKKMILNLGHHLPALYKNGYTVEIHNRLFDENVSRQPEANDFFSNAVEIFVGTTKALILQEDVHLRFLIQHFKKHARFGSCQLRLFTDIFLLDETTTVRVPDSFISNPKQENRPECRRAAYKAAIRSVPRKYRLKYLAGDIFPSLVWMKQRYKCSGLRALLYYPVRVGKIMWLV